MRTQTMTHTEAKSIATAVAATIDGYRSDNIIMDFVTSEAREKVAAEIRAEMGGGTTAKAVELLEVKYPNIMQRVCDYVDLGLLGCFIASQKSAA